jgi:hypothetical protein
MMKSILTTIVFLALAVAGLAQTRNVIVNTNGVVQSPTNFWSADASNARTGLGLGSAATNPASAFQPSSVALSNLSSSSLGVSGTLAISNGGTGATNASTARTNLGLGLPALTNSDLSGFLSAIGLGISNSVSFENVSAINGSIKVLEGTNEVVLLNSDEASYFANPINFLNTNALNLTRDHLGLKRIVTIDQGQSGWITGIYDDTNATNPIIVVGGQAGVTLYGPIIFGGAATVTNRALSRTNLGLGWSALTNTNTSGFNASLYGSGTNPVLYSTNGEVVSPTNFWQVAPIVTRFVESQPTTNQTTNITAARNLHIHSLAISTTGVTNTISLPTTNSFDGDIALVVHQGPTSSVTAVRTAGASTNLITLNQFEEAVEFVYYNSVWQFNHNQSFIEPIYFSGTNATANAAASRTNLGGTTVGNAVFTATNAAAAADAIGLGATNQVGFDSVQANDFTVSDGGTFSFEDTGSIEFGNAAGSTRTNLGIPLAALTNTNSANFQAAIFNTNSTPTNGANVNAVNFNTAIHWMEVNVVTNGVTNNFRIPLFK